MRGTNPSLLSGASAMNKKYIVTLTPEERHELEALVGRGKAAVRKLKRAWTLLKADVSPGGPAWSDEAIQEAYDVGLVTIYRVRQTFVERGVPAILTPRPRQVHRHRKLDGDQEAHLIALACSSLHRVAAVGRCVCWPRRRNWATPSASRRRPSVRR
jgi:hypothetical protein